MAQDAEVALETMQTVTSTYETLNSTSEWLNNVLGKIDEYESTIRLTTDLGASYENLINTCIYGYNWATKALQTGTISPSDFSYFVLILDNAYRKGARTIKETTELIAAYSGLTKDEKQKKLQEQTKENNATANAINGTINNLEQSALTALTRSKYDEFIESAFNKVVNKQEYNVSKQQARKNIQEESAAVSDGGQQIKELKDEISSSTDKGESILNFVTAIIGLLAIIMSIPAYFKYTKGERQAQDNIYKLIMGTIIIIVIIQAFGRVILSFL